MQRGAEISLRSAVVTGGLLVLTAFGCSVERHSPPTSSRSSDSAFAAVQERGKEVMGVDQYTSQHVFEDLPDGGRIVLERDDSTDASAIATIRAHMHEIATQFSAGNFALPGMVHAMAVPGTAVMAEQKGRIHYMPLDRPRGAELRIQTSDSAAVAAVHEFLAFQRMDHRAAGEEHNH
jgi:hypothetical protein